MEEKLISVVIPKRTYDLIRNYCFNKGVKIKHFVAAALVSALKEIGEDGKKSTKR